jgi:hypothetical protein
MFERVTGRRFVEHFDLITGTSTGGIITIGLAIGATAEDICRFYETEGATIFLKRERIPKWLGRIKHVVGRDHQPGLRGLRGSVPDYALEGRAQSFIGEPKLGPDRFETRDWAGRPDRASGLAVEKRRFSQAARQHPRRTFGLEPEPGSYAGRRSSPRQASRDQPLVLLR